MRKFSMCTTQSLRYRGTFVALLLLLATCLSAQVTWTGGINVFWNTNGNWSSGTVPTLSDEVIIPAGATNMPFVPNFYIANFATLEIQSGATIGFGFRCTMAGTGGITNYGTLAMVNSTVTCASDIENYNLFEGSNFFLDQVIGAPMPTFTNKTGAVMNLNSGGNRTFKFGIINESGATINKTEQNVQSTIPYFENQLGGIVNVSGSLVGFQFANLTNNGTINVDADCFFNLFAGAGNATLTGDGTVENMSMNAGSLTIDGSPTITGNLLIYAGKVILTSGDLSVGSFSYGPFANPSNNYVVTPSTGRLVRALSGSTLFPVGPSTSAYNPVTLNGGSDQFAVRVKVPVAIPTPSNDYVNVQWDIDRLSGTTSAVVALQWNTSQEVGNFAANRNVSAVVGWTGAAFESFGTGSAINLGSNNYVRTSDTPVSNFSQFVVSTLADDDNDGVADIDDNCPAVGNADQLDTDGDGEGDVCDLDDDNDGTSDADEIACGSDPLNPNSTCNQAPVAICQDITLSADENCEANGTIDNGSYDPDGDQVTITLSPVGPYALGTTSVTLTIDDGTETAQCTATVTVSGIDTDGDTIADCEDPDDDNDGIDDACDSNPLVNNFIFTGIADLPAEWLCGNNNDKVLVCHIPPGNPANAHTICVSPNAVQAHLDHGCMLGECTDCTSAMMTVPHGNTTGDASSNFDHADLEIFPNPVTDMVNFHLHGTTALQTKLVIYDNLGRVVWQRSVAQDQTSLQVDLTGSNFKAGIYMVAMTSGEETITKRLVISK